MNCMRASSMWMKRLLASILPLSLLMAAPADNIPLFGPGHAIAAAVQEEAGAALSGDDEEKMWHEEERMGSLETGKLANLTVFDKNFMRDDFKDTENAKCLATYVDGELVYNV